MASRKEGLQVVPGTHPVKNGAKGSRKASRKASHKVSRKAKPWNLQHLPHRTVKGFPWPKTLLWQPWCPPLKAPLQDAHCGGAGWLAMTRGFPAVRGRWWGTLVPDSSSKKRRRQPMRQKKLKDKKGPKQPSLQDSRGKYTEELDHTDFPEPMAPKSLWKFWSAPASVHIVLVSVLGKGFGHDASLFSPLWRFATPYSTLPHFATLCNMLWPVLWAA